MATGRIGTTPVLQVRWSKAPTNGTTSLSGLDDNSVSLVYSVGYEAVYRNGVLLSRGNDYTATNGTTVTLIDATITGDIIEIFANQTVPLSDTFSQTVADGRFIKNTLTTTTGDIIYASGANTPARLGIGSSAQVLTVSGGIPAWAAPASASFVGWYLYNSAVQSLANATATNITMDSEFYDTNGFHTGSNATITIPSGQAGKYLLVGAITYAANATGQRYANFNINSSGATNPQLVFEATASGIASTLIVNVWDLAVGDTVALQGNQTSGGNLNVVVQNKDITYFSGAKIG